MVMNIKPRADACLVYPIPTITTKIGNEISKISSVFLLFFAKIYNPKIKINELKNLNPVILFEEIDSN